MALIALLSSPVSKFSTLTTGLWPLSRI